MDKLRDSAAQQLERVKALTARSGLSYLDLPPAPLGVGIGVSFGENDYVVLSVIEGELENQLQLTSGLLCDIKQDRSSALEVANDFNNPGVGYHVMLHDANVGWAFLVQQIYPIQLLLEVPQFFTSCVNALPRVAIEYRGEINEKWDIGGRPWIWNEEDRYNLLMRSMA